MQKPKPHRSSTRGSSSAGPTWKANSLSSRRSFVVDAFDAEDRCLDGLSVIGTEAEARNSARSIREAIPEVAYTRWAEVKRGEVWEWNYEGARDA